MGQEFAQREEWTEARGLDWWLLDAGMHEGVRRLVRDLNRPTANCRRCMRATASPRASNG